MQRTHKRRFRLATDLQCLWYNSYFSFNPLSFLHILKRVPWVTRPPYGRVCLKLTLYTWPLSTNNTIPRIRLLHRLLGIYSIVKSYDYYYFVQLIRRKAKKKKIKTIINKRPYEDVDSTGQATHARLFSYEKLRTPLLSTRWIFMYF